MCRRLGVHLSERAPDDIALERVESGELLSILPDERRRAVQARVLDDKSYEQIAREHATSVPAVRKRVSRALSALRSRFEEEP